MDTLFLQAAAIPYSTYGLIALFGAFGGFLYGTRLSALTFPHRKPDSHALHLGFINDLLVGIGGAIVIFLIVPGTFEFDPTKPVEFLRGIATAFLGGYGGYALIDKVLNQKLKEIEEKMEEEKVQSRTEAQLKEWIDSYLREESEKLPKNTDEIAKQIREASLKTQTEILTAAQDARKNAFIKFVRQPDAKKPEAEREYQQYVEKVFFLFEALANIPDADKYHRIYGQLAFACKGKLEADYRRALDNIEKAIATRQDQPGGEMYEFNRAICQLMLKKEGKLEESVKFKRNVAQDLIKFAGTKAGQHILPKMLDETNKKPDTIRMWQEDNAVIDFLATQPAVQDSLVRLMPETPPEEPLEEETEADRGI